MRVNLLAAGLRVINPYFASIRSPTRGVNCCEQYVTHPESACGFCEGSVMKTPIGQETVRRPFGPGIPDAGRHPGTNLSSTSDLASFQSYCGILRGSQYQFSSIYAGSGARMSILYLAQRVVSLSVSGAVGIGRTRCSAGVAISVIIPTNPVPGMAKMSIVAGAVPVHRIPCGELRGKKIYSPGPRTVFFLSRIKVNSPSSTKNASSSAW
jgi:hypothetical protein